MKPMLRLVMFLIVLLEAFWFLIVLLVFHPSSYPAGVILIFVSWVMIVASLVLLLRRARRAALQVAYGAAVLASATYAAGGGKSDFPRSLVPALPFVIFLVAAQASYRIHPESSRRDGELR